MQKVHIDTDLGGDLDDLCALAMVLRWSPPVEMTGVTVVGDTGGKRTAATRYVLNLAGRPDIPTAAGADTAGGYYPYALGLPPEERYWPEPLGAAPNPPEVAIELLRQSIEQGATIVGIGPLTNFALLEQRYPGILEQADLYLMGGYVYPPRPGFPAWTNADDFNVQVDARSAYHVLTRSTPTLISLAVTVETALRAAHLPRLRTHGRALGQLIARQAVEFAADEQMAQRFGATCAGVPDDIINFQHDGLACAIALGYREGVEIEEIPLHFAMVESELVASIDPQGKPLRVVTKVDGLGFSDFWLKTLAPG